MTFNNGSEPTLTGNEISGDSLVLTERGLVRVCTLDSARSGAAHPPSIIVAGEEYPNLIKTIHAQENAALIYMETSRGYHLLASPTHRIKAMSESSGQAWKTLQEVEIEDQLPLRLGGLIGQPQSVWLPPLSEPYWTVDCSGKVPREVTADLAEFVGYFMGDGSLHAKGLRLCVAESDPDVADRLASLAESLFNLPVTLRKMKGYTEVAVHSVRLVEWWEACNFAKALPHAEHKGKGYSPHIPDAILHTNNREIYAAFIRGLFEADATTQCNNVTWTTATESFGRSVQTLLLALGFTTTRKAGPIIPTGWGSNRRYTLRLLNVFSASRFIQQIGFVSERKRALLREDHFPQTERYDHVPVTREIVDRLAPANDRLRKILLMSLARHGTVSRRAADELLERSNDNELGRLLGYFYDRVTKVDVAETQPPYTMRGSQGSTYIANGFMCRT